MFELALQASYEGLLPLAAVERIEKEYPGAWVIELLRKDIKDGTNPTATAEA